MTKVIWEVGSEDGIMITAPTKRAAIAALKLHFLASAHQSRRICRTCYEVRVKSDISGEWRGRFFVRTQLPEQSR